MNLHLSRAVVALLGVAVFLSAIALIDARHQNRVLFEQLDQLHADRDQLNIDWGRLLLEEGEDELRGALREFAEEVGLAVVGDFVRLAPMRQPGGRTVLCWLVEADLDLSGFRSNTFEMEWPPRSGRTLVAPECDRAEYFGADAALAKILPGQQGFIRQALQRLGDGAAL